MRNFERLVDQLEEHGDESLGAQRRVAWEPCLTAVCLLCVLCNLSFFHQPKVKAAIVVS